MTERRAFAVALALVIAPAAFADDAAAHAALAHWLEGRADRALLVINANARPPAAQPGSGNEASARLRNIGARIHYDEYRDGAAPSPADALRHLRAAEAYAAAAVWDDPYELRYWRDFVRIAAEQRIVSRRTRRRTLTQSEALARLGEDLIRRPLRYPDMDPDFVLTSSPELRQVGLAAVRYAQNDIFDAQRVLRSWVAEPRSRRRCAAAAVLSELEFELDRVSAAMQLVDGMLESCRGGAANALKLKRGYYALRLRRARELHADPNDQPASRHEPAYTEFIDVLATSRDTALDVADRLLQDPSRIEDWHMLWRVAGTDRKMLYWYDALLRRSPRSEPAVARAWAYRHIERGKFEDAQPEIRALLADGRHGSDAELLVASVLLDADSSVDAHPDVMDRLAAARRADPYLVSCIDSRQLNLCLGRKRNCSLATLLCGDAREFVYDVYKQGLKFRPDSGTVEGILAVRGQVQYNEQMIRDTEARLMAEIRSREEAVDRRIEAVESRLRTIVDIAVAKLERDLRAQRTWTDAQIRARVAKASEQVRAETEAKIARVAEQALAARVGANQALSQFERARILTHYAVDLEVLNALRGEIARLIEQERSRIQPIIDQLLSAVAQLQQPELVRSVNILHHWDKEPYERVANAILNLLNEGLQIAAMPGRGWVKLSLAVVPLSKAVSDFFMDARNRARQRQQRR